MMHRHAAMWRNGGETGLSCMVNVNPNGLSQVHLGMAIHVAPRGVSMLPTCRSSQDNEDEPEEHYVVVRRGERGGDRKGISNRRSPSHEDSAMAMAKVPSRYKKRQYREGQNVWSPREVVSRVLALNHWDDIDGVLNCWLGRFNRKNFPPLMAVSKLFLHHFWFVVWYGCRGVF